MTSALIIGGSGFAGRHLAAELKSRGRAVVATGVRDEPGIRACRVEDPKAVRRLVAETRPDEIFHLAAPAFVPDSFRDPLPTTEAVVMGTAHVLEAARLERPKARVLVVSSGEVYGPQLGMPGRPLEEQDPQRPCNPYAAAKAAAEHVGLGYVRGYRLGVVIARSFNHIGPGQSDRFAVSSFARQLARIGLGCEPPVLRVGNLAARRDFTDVRDVVRAYRLLVEKGEAGEVYNVCSGVSVSIEKVLQRLIELSGSAVRVETDPERLRPSDVPEFLGSHAKLSARTGWRPEVSLDQSLLDALEAWRAAESRSG